MNKQIEVTIEKMVFGGQGLARDPDGKVLFVWNALPGETVLAEIVKRKKDHIEAVAIDIIAPSKDRVEPIDPHYLSSSPWQILNPKKEEQYKIDIAVETYAKIGDLILSHNPPKIITDEQIYGYRNKMEFSFVELEDGTKSLAFFQRGKKYRISAKGSALAKKEINETAQHILSWVNEKNIPMRSLKSLILRANEQGEILAGLFIKDELSFSDFPSLTDTLKGCFVYYSTHKSPASVPTKLLHHEGVNYIEESILGTPLAYGLFSFFQINVPLFTLALKDMAAFLDPKKPLIDFYSGVGAIGLPISHAREQTILIESNAEAVDFAKRNIQKNALKHCEAHCIPSEKMTEQITKDHQIILDPPRAGLHKDVIQALLAKKPERILYLSCNISTQARDMRLLSQLYKPAFVQLYNFFPRTPHFEGLVVLDRV